MSKRTSITACLVRCGDTTWDHESRLHGATDLPLSDSGRASVTADATRLHGGINGALISTIYHPPDEAAAETALILARAVSAKTKSVEDLADPNLGLLEGLLRQELAERFPKRNKQWQDDPLSLIPPEGEPIADARARIFGAAAKLLRKSRAAEVAIVLHPMAFGLLRGWLCDRPADELWQVLDDAVRVERFAIAASILDRLRDAARSEAVES